MKTLLSLVCFVLLPLAALAAEPVVVVENTGNVRVDGVNVGAPADAIANNPSLAPAIQNALATFVAKVQTDAATERDNQVAAKETEKQAAISAANDASAAAIAANAAELATAKSNRDKLAAHVAELNAYIATLRQTVTGLGGVSAAPPSAPTLD